MDELQFRKVMHELMVHKRLVDDAEHFLGEEKEGITGKQVRIYENEKFKESQLRNVINVASSSRSVPVVLNFIKYQIGRREEWQHKKFGEYLLDRLIRLSPTAQQIASRPEVKGSEEEIHLRLVELYLGYMNRYFKYKSKSP